MGDPEPVGYADLAGRTLDGCTDDVIGWVLDASLPMSSVRLRLPQTTSNIHSVYARLRLTTTRACVERVSGQLDNQSPEHAAMLTRPGASRATAAAHPGDVMATAFAAQSRLPLRCAVTK